MQYVYCPDITAPVDWASNTNLLTYLHISDALHSFFNFFFVADMGMKTLQSWVCLQVRSIL